jgi:predicted ATPase/class 3 adenylate cyclase/tetratricopeptide (TPR) repeat protein
VEPEHDTAARSHGREPYRLTPVLPTGELTFCFTDVEGSTVLLRRLGEQYDRVIATHHRLLRDAMASRGGTVVRTDGDAFFVVFERAADAVAACADAQEIVTAHPWPSGVALRVRMGLHTGPARLNSEGEYVGLAIHQAARIAAAANGGQVLLSAATAAQAGAPEGASSFRPVGAFRLKDFDESVALVELVRPGAPFAPPRALPAAGHNLALRRTSFVGRVEELELLASLAEQRAVVSLVGTGGVGKTRLAVEFGVTAATDFADGVWFVELTEVDGAERLHAAVAHALGAHVGVETDAVAAITNAVGSRRLLLILDSCEHVVADVAGLIEDLVAVCPSVVVLATSRQRLDVTGERVLRLGPLDVAPAGTAAQDLMAYEGTRLFLDRAGLSSALTPDDAAAVVTICASLDGLPLGVELAAARAPTLGVQTVSTHLHDVVLRTGDGTSETTTGARRRRTLQAAIRWSYELLTDDERCALERLSVFHGGFTIAACAAVLGHPPIDEATVPGLVAALVEKSLVEQDPNAGRFRLLGPVQAFASEAFDRCDRAAAVRDQHAAFYASATGLDDGPDEDLDLLFPEAWVLRRLCDEANFVAARSRVDDGSDAALQLDTTVALLTRAQGRFRHAYDLVNDSVRRADRRVASPRVYAAACLVASLLGRACGYFVQSLEHCATAVEIARNIGDLGLELDAHAFAQTAASVQGDVASSGVHEELARRIARELGGAATVRVDRYFTGGPAAGGDPDRASAMEDVRRARRAMRTGAHDEARALAEEAATAAARLGARAIEAFALWVLAELCTREEHHDEGRSLLDRAVALGLEGGPEQVGIALETYGRIMALELDRHEHQAMLDALARVQAIDVERDGPEKAIHEHRLLGELALDRGDASAALAGFERSLELARGSGYREMEVRLLLLIGNGRVVDGDLAGAARAYEEAVDLARRLERADTVAVLTYNLALVDHRSAEADRARDRLEGLVADGPDLPAWLAGLATLELGVLVSEAGDVERARSLLADALSGARSRRDRRCEQRCLEQLARLDGGDDGNGAGVFVAPIVER